MEMMRRWDFLERSLRHKLLRRVSLFEGFRDGKGRRGRWCWWPRMAFYLCSVGRERLEEYLCLNGDWCSAGVYEEYSDVFGE